MVDWIKIGLGSLCLLFAYLHCCTGQMANTGGMTTLPAATAPLANIPPQFSARLTGDLAANGKITLDGVLPSEAARKAVLDRATQLYGADGFVDNKLRVSGPGVGNVQAPANWLNWVLGLLPVPKSGAKAGGFELGPDQVTVRGELPDKAAQSKYLQAVTATLPANVTLNDLTTVANNALSEAQLKVQSDINKILIKGIEFATGKAQITPAGAAVLDQVVTALKDNPDVKIEVGGHTDNVGSPASNDTLSQARANAVKAYLAGKTIAPDRLVAKGYGQNQPIADNNTDEGRQRNRRIEFDILAGNGNVETKK